MKKVIALLRKNLKQQNDIAYQQHCLHKLSKVDYTKKKYLRAKNKAIALAKEITVGIEMLDRHGRGLI